MSNRLFIIYYPTFLWCEKYTHPVKDTYKKRARNRRVKISLYLFTRFYTTILFCQEIIILRERNCLLVYVRFAWRLRLFLVTESLACNVVKYFLLLKIILCIKHIAQISIRELRSVSIMVSFFKQHNTAYQTVYNKVFDICIPWEWDVKWPTKQRLTSPPSASNKRMQSLSNSMRQSGLGAVANLWFLKLSGRNSFAKSSSMFLNAFCKYLMTQLCRSVGQNKATEGGLPKAHDAQNCRSLCKEVSLKPLKFNLSELAAVSVAWQCIGLCEVSWTLCSWLTTPSRWNLQCKENSHLISWY